MTESPIIAESSAFKENIFNLYKVIVNVHRTTIAEENTIPCLLFIFGTIPIKYKLFYFLCKYIYILSK
jgi:exonuclease V gamma subunit